MNSQRKEEFSQKWFVFHTRSRWEKKINRLLKLKGFEPFLPLQGLVRQWSDRKKKVQVPLFNSYIFVKAAENQIANILEVPGIAWNIKYNEKPAVLREGERITIKRFLETGLFVETSNAVDLEPGEKVRVMDGPLKGCSGTLTGPKNDEKFTILLENINQALRIEIDRGLLEKNNATKRKVMREQSGNCIL